LALAQLKRRQGKLPEAAEAFRKLAADPEWALPKDHAVMEMARTLDQAQKTAEARAAYKRVTDEFPDSVYAGEARRRAEELASAG
jgi:TolA-binding protein